jgi:23S rRNA (uracil-5-)-methyltransferase RumA
MAMKTEKQKTAAAQNQATARQAAGSGITLRPGQNIRVTIRRLGINGEGVGYYKRQVVFIDGALPGEVVAAEIVDIETNYAVGKLKKIMQPSPQRVEPACPVYRSCGGCQLQHLSYPGQLEAKMEMVREAFRRYTGLKEVPLRPIAGMDHPWAYRNKAQLQAGYMNGKMVAGLYAPGTHHIVELTDCPIQHPKTNEIIQGTRNVLEELNIPAYDERKKTGVVRTIVARIGFETEDCQLTLVTATEKIPREAELVQRLRARLPDVKSIMQNVNPRKTSLIFGDKTRVLWGASHIDEQLGEVKFSLSPRAFFQLNPEQTVKLYNYVKEAAALTGRELVVDAYCGVGTIGLWLAPEAKEVRGIEIIPEAVEDAKRNARRSRINNARFYAGKAEAILPQWVKQGIKPDVVVVDPPRSGCGRPLLEALVKVKPKRIVYVSCNPATLAKDCDVLLKGGFGIEWIQPVDMFPHTAHVECIVSTYRVDK